MQGSYLTTFLTKLRSRFRDEVFWRRMALYRRRPEAFAIKVLGSRWWEKQREAARAVASSRRTAVKSANGVGKTYLAADLALWFLYTHRPALVLTTAPTERQVRHLLWEEIRRRFRGARVALPGELRTTRLQVGEGWFALGLSTDEGVRFQGFHAENLLIVFDEASGIPEEIWEAAEGVAVGRNNRILAIGNPLCTSGRFYRIFQEDSGWTKRTISALDHPNVTGRGPAIPGAVTPEAIDERVREWCEEIGSLGDRVVGSLSAQRPNDPMTQSPDIFVWRGRRYRPNNAFRIRVLGEFPDAEDDSLIPLRWIEAAMARTLPAKGCRRAAADIARFGGDSTVIGVRAGPVVTRMDVTRGADTMEVAGRIVQMARAEKPESIAVDSIGLGAGVLDRLNELGVQGVEGVNVALPAGDPERFANRRAELYWGLRERFRAGDIAIPHDEALCEELTAIRYRHTSRGQIEIESKEEMKKRGLHSPDRADMLALLFDGGGETLPPREAESAPSPARMLREEMARWEK
jgi:phage terminase large subunit